MHLKNYYLFTKNAGNGVPAKGRDYGTKNAAWNLIKCHHCGGCDNHDGIRPNDAEKN